MALATRYRRRALSEVAADLLELAENRAPEAAEAVRSEIEAFFAAQPTPEFDKDRFLEEARRTLPRRLYEQVEHAYTAGAQAGAIEFIAGARKA